MVSEDTVLQTGMQEGLHHCRGRLLVICRRPNALLGNRAFKEFTKICVPSNTEFLVQWLAIVITELVNPDTDSGAQALILLSYCGIRSVLDRLHAPDLVLCSATWILDASISSTLLMEDSASLLCSACAVPLSRARKISLRHRFSVATSLTMFAKMLTCSTRSWLRCSAWTSIVSHTSSSIPEVSSISRI
jgi:hypothetical protein